MSGDSIKPDALSQCMIYDSPQQLHYAGETNPIRLHSRPEYNTVIQRPASGQNPGGGDRVDGVS